MNKHPPLSGDGLESSGSRILEDIIICPACGGENPGDAIFCNHEHGNQPCHKALGEFKYVLEEFMAERSRIERLADQVTQFVGQPNFVIVHVLWFIIWILANSGLLGYFQIFDEYPYSLLGIILGIEAVLITGFLLISQNHQNVYADKCAQLDYEINIRSYRRKLLELEKRFDLLSNTTRQGTQPNENS